MRRSYPLHVAAASLWAVLLAGCQPGSQWIGLIVGDPTGVCYRQDLSRSDAASFALDLQRIGNDFVHAHADWLRYEPSWQGHDISFYWGLGAEFASWTENAPSFADAADTTYVAVRVPLGLELELSAASPEVLLFLQIVPTVPLEENTGLHVHAALGIVFGF